MDLLRDAAQSPSVPERRPPLLVALRRTARPDRARVEAYASLFNRHASWDAYGRFLEAHRAWLLALDRALEESGTGTPGPLPGGAATAAVSLLPPPRTPAETLGYLYVLESFRLGSSVLARRIRGPGGGARAATDDGSPCRPWGALRHALEAVPPEEYTAVIRGARDAFSAWEQELSAPLAALGVVLH